MGLYVYIDERDQKNWRKVEDPEIDFLLQKALRVDKTLMISSYEYHTERIFRKTKIETFYNVYHECFLKGISTFQAMQQLSGSGNKKVVCAYLYGIINGASAEIRNKT